MFNWNTIGNTKIATYLQNSIVKNRLSHAYLFLGAKNIGKLELAKNFSQSILCYNFHKLKNLKLENYPCNKCVHCLQFEKNTHSDIYYVKRIFDEKNESYKKNISVEQIRELEDKLNKKSFLNLKKIAIIQEAEYLSEAASNSLLKTLEEPKSDTILILLSSKADLILPTIYSRCQVFRLLPAKTGEIYDYLVQKGANRELAKTLSKLALGAPQTALENFRDSEMLSKRTEMINVFFDLLENKLYKNFEIIDELVKSREKNDLILCLDLWQTVLRDIFLYKLSLSNSCANSYFMEKLGRAEKKMSILKVKELLDKINDTKRYIRQNVSSSLALENFVLDFDK